MELGVSWLLTLMLAELSRQTAHGDTIHYLPSALVQSLLPHVPVSRVIDASNKIFISQINSTTSSFAIQWKYLNTFNGTHKDTVVGYVTGNTNGRFVSDNLGVLSNEFEFKHLQPDTRYSVCVELLEIVDRDRVASEGATVSHFKCVEMSTIAAIRIDSILAVIITIGYLIFMGVVGCIVWRHRVLVNGRTRLEEEDADVEESSTVRWKDMEEKQRLNSIEDSVDV